MIKIANQTALLATLLVIGCDKSMDPTPSAAAATKEPEAAATEQFSPRLMRRFKAVRPAFEVDGPIDEKQIALGRMLYFETRLSRDRDLSCNSCHKLTDYGVDGAKTSAGRQGSRGARNSPTVYHAAGQFAQFWDGRASTVEDQAKGPILNPTEMGMRSPADVVAVLKSIPGYAPHFRAAFPKAADPITYDLVAQAIGAFERKLVTPSRWDRFIAGDKNALTAPEIQGLKVFTDLGCMTCHTGEFLGGSSFQKVGVVNPWPNQKDQGRFEVTKDPVDKMMFKVPSLRNVAKTAPYFHDGSAPTLEGAVRTMANHQLGIELADDEIRSIVTWMQSLTGDLPHEYISEPKLPPDGPTTKDVIARSAK
jgi:cytochrome c peroxidase